MGGYSGWGVWLVGAVLAFNLACIPAWFLVNHLRRNHDFAIKKVRTFLHLLEQEREADRTWRADAELGNSVAMLTEQVDEAEGLGPLWGRKQAALAQLSMHQLGDRWPELVEGVHSKMDRPT